MICNELIQIYTDLLTKMKWKILSSIYLNESITNQHLVAINALQIWNEMISLQVATEHGLTTFMHSIYTTISIELLVLKEANCKLVSVFFFFFLRN